MIISTYSTICIDNYAFPSDGDTTLDNYGKSFFASADSFMIELKQIIKLRDEMQPQASLWINEIGCGSGAEPSFGWDKFWNLCSSYYAYMYSEIAMNGGDVAGQSQMIGMVNGTVTEWPSTSMVDWRTGAPNSRYMVLKMLIDAGFGDNEITKLMHATVSSVSGVYTQAYSIPSLKRFAVILINKTSTSETMTLSPPPSSCKATTINKIDIDTVSGETYSTQTYATIQLTIPVTAFATVIVIYE